MMVAMSDTFGAFLRSRRERLSPEEVGLPAAGRRRTPGLRREEVAALAGISVDYLVRLEQGRETHPSPSVLRALERTLRLSRDESMHMKVLASEAACGPLCPMAEAEAELTGPTRALLDQLGEAGTPAFVLGHVADLLAWNEPYAAVMVPTGVLDAAGGDPPNLLRYTFLDPRSRELYEDWEGIAREQVGNLRTVTGRFRDDGSVAALVGELSVRSAEFATLWAAHDVGEKRQGVKDLVHPVVGALRLQYTTLLTPDDDGMRLVVYLPAADVDRKALADLVTPETPTHLRVVGE